MHGFHRLATCTPIVRVADVTFNCEHILELATEARRRDAAVALFPELAVTAYSCGDLFHSAALLNAAERGVQTLLERLPQDTIFVIGAPVRAFDRLFNAALVIQNGRLLAAVPKSNLPNYREFYEKRWFASGHNLKGATIAFAGQTGIPFGTDLIVTASDLLALGVEICEDMWTTIPPSSILALNGATLIVNPSASNELVGKAAYRTSLVCNQSARCVCAYAYTSSGVHESTTDIVNGGHQLVAENGSLLLDAGRFCRSDSIHFADVDLQRIAYARLSDSPFRDSGEMLPAMTCRRIPAAPVPDPADCLRSFPRHPFVPADHGDRTERCEEIFAIQTAGLARRIEHTHAKKLVLGISGGLDSTLALLVCARTLQLLGRPPHDLVAVTMPGFGTTGRTYNNAVGLCRQLNADLREIPIANACTVHFQDIGHDPACHDVVYENSQARERTQILLDLANQLGGLAIGTGDLSESAMGWCTYNGDHISMYSVNCTIPKTLIRYLIAWYGDLAGDETRRILQDIIDTPVSPELIPPDEHGNIQQKTEDIIGPYEVHDFFLYHFLKYGASPDKLLFLATRAFEPDFSPEQLKRFLNGFLRRFFSQQFKRSCLPDGPKVGTIALSPRGDWRMPSDASNAEWLRTLEP